MNLSSFFNGNSATSGNIPADVYNKVTKIMQAQKTDAPKLNAALATDQTTLSGLGQLQSALTPLLDAAKTLRDKGSSQLAQNVTTLVSAFNALNAKLTELQQGALKSDGSASRIKSQLAAIFNTGSSGANGSTSGALAKIGIGMQKNGNLALDAAKLQAGVSANPTAIAKLFTDGSSGIADKLTSQITGLVGSSGVLPTKVTAINKDITTLNAKRTALENKLTAQATALVKFYTQQSNSNGTTQASGATNLGNSLFNYLA